MAPKKKTRVPTLKPTIAKAKSLTKALNKIEAYGHNSPGQRLKIAQAKDQIHSAAVILAQCGHGRTGKSCSTAGTKLQTANIRKPANKSNWQKFLGLK